MSFEKELFIPGGEEDKDLANLHIERQLEGVKEDNKCELLDDEVKQYILDHSKDFESRNQVISLIELQAMTRTVPDLKEHIEKELIPMCVHYTGTVAEFDAWARQFAAGEMTSEEFEEKSQSRSRTHDAMIADFNVLIREARKVMGDQEWMDRLENRSDYAKLALQIAAEKLLA